MPTERMFPIQGETDRNTGIKRKAGQVPWGIAQLAYNHYSKLYGTSQSLERLAERGGFGWSELYNFLKEVEHNDYKSVPTVKVFEK